MFFTGHQRRHVPGPHSSCQERRRGGYNIQELDSDSIYLNKRFLLS